VRCSLRALTHAPWGALALVLTCAFACDVLAATRRTVEAGGKVTARTDRVDELLRQEIGAIVARDVADPRIGFTTITKVETTPDLRHAKVWVSVIGQPAERRGTVAALQRAMPFVRHELGRALRIKRIPDLHVYLDETAERGTRVLQLLNELGEGSAHEGDLPLGETLPTPVARVHHEGDEPEEPPSAVIPPKPRARRRAGPHGNVPGSKAGSRPRPGRRR
jgi:ribosome-binding factor A